MPCILAFIVLSILGLFSATHRALAREAFDCVFRRITLKPCDTGFDTKIKAQILGRAIKYSPRLAKLINRYFEALAWIFMIALTISSFYFSYGLFNFYRYGSCNGLNQAGFCVFDPTGQSNQVTGAGVGSCGTGDDGKSEATLSLNLVNQTLFPQVEGNSDQEIFFIGCYGCEFTRQTYPLIKDLIDKYQPSYRFAHLSTKPETAYLDPITHCTYLQDESVYWQLIDYLYTAPVAIAKAETEVQSYLNLQGIDLNLLNECVTNPETQKHVINQSFQLSKIGLYGTPTVFINDTPTVGPKPYRVYRRLLLKSWF